MDAPWPPVYPKQPNEPPRVAPSRARKAEPETRVAGGRAARILPPDSRAGGVHGVSQRRGGDRRRVRVAAPEGARRAPVRDPGGVHPRGARRRRAGARRRRRVRDRGGFPSEGGLQMSICEVAEYMAIHPRWFDSTDIGGAAFISHAGHAALAIAAGMADVVVVSYAAAGYSGIPEIPFADYGTNNAGPGPVRDPVRPVDGVHLRARRDAPHARVRHHARAARADRRAVPRQRREQPRRALPRPDRGRRRARLADDRDAAAPARLLHRVRLRRRLRDDLEAQGRAARAEGASTCSAAARRSASSR